MRLARDARVKFAGIVTMRAPPLQREDPVELGEAQVRQTDRPRPTPPTVSDTTISSAGSELSDSRYSTPPTSTSNMWILR